jgi:hypothetical protein
MRGSAMAQRMHIRTSGRYYLQAADGGGGAISAAGPWPREWETFEVAPAASRHTDLATGTPVQVRTVTGRYITVDAAGALSAAAASPLATAPFTLVAAAGEPSVLRHLGRFGLRDTAGRFLTADGGGGGGVRTGPTVLGANETLVAQFHPEPPEFAATVSLRLRGGTAFVQAVGGGGADLALGPWARQWETFDIVAADRDGRGLPDGALVNVRTSSGHYWHAGGGGGGKVLAAGIWPREWETFTLAVPGPRPWLQPGGQVSLRAANGSHISVEMQRRLLVPVRGTLYTSFWRRPCARLGYRQNPRRERSALPRGGNPSKLTADAVPPSPVPAAVGVPVWMFPRLVAVSAIRVLFAVVNVDLCGAVSLAVAALVSAHAADSICATPGVNAVWRRH